MKQDSATLVGETLMTTDFRALCAELADELDAQTGYTRKIDGKRITHPDVVRARTALAQPEPEGPTPQPVPVSERLPGPEDCDAEGDVWAWRRFDSEGDMDNGDFWCLAFCEWLEDEDCNFTHWLPAHALPLPSHD